MLLQCVEEEFETLFRAIFRVWLIVLNLRNPFNPFFIRLLNMGMVAQSQTGKQKPHTKANNIPNNAFLGNQRCITFSDKNTWIKDDNKTPMNKKGIACNRMPKKILITVLVDMFHNGKKVLAKT